MTTPPDTAATRRTSAALAEEALTTVFGATAVASLREDSPLSALQLDPEDLVCLADAVARAAASRGIRCWLDDAALEELRTVSDLVTAIAQASSPPASRATSPATSRGESR